MSERVKVIKMRNVPDKWQRLLLHLQNAPEGAFRIVFDNPNKAGYARDRLRRSMELKEWYSLLITTQGCNVYVINTKLVQKVRLENEKDN